MGNEPLRLLPAPQQVQPHGFDGPAKVGLVRGQLRRVRYLHNVIQLSMCSGAQMASRSSRPSALGLYGLALHEEEMIKQESN